MEWVLGSILDSLLGGEDSDEPLLPALARYMEFAATAELPGPAKQRLPIHRVIDASVRFPAVRANFGRLVERVVERIAARLTQAQERGEIRRDLDAHGTASLIMLIGFGSLVVEAGGAPVELPKIMRTGFRALESPRTPES
jgi:hypothetical protein